MSRGRRVAFTVVGYAVLSVALIPVFRGVRSLLLLPPLFMTLALGLLALGLPVALLVAWRYPDVGSPPDE